MEKSDFQSKYDRESLLKVRSEYGVCKNLIGSLSSKLSKVSSHIEKEFLASYRVHMLSVQEELRDLKNQVVDAEVALNDDEEVSRLEHEVTWFSDETTRLRNQSNSMRKDMQHVITRIDALREQRQYLNEQLKTTLKRSRILEAEMNIFSESQKASEAEASFELSMGGFDSLEQTDEVVGEITPGPSKNQQEGEDTYSRVSAAPNVRRSQSTSALPIIKTTTKLRQQVAAPDDILLKKKTSVRDLRSTHVSAVEELRQLEESRLSIELDLEAAIKSVFADIIDRKVRTVERTSVTKGPRESTWRINAAAGGLTGLGLQHFSDTDRLAAIATFLGTPKHFKKITETLSEELEL
jgi:hypothetical protein